jgi:hypothetical protein
MSESSTTTTDHVRDIDAAEVARRAVTSPAHLVSFGERGFRTVITARVIDHLTLTVGLERRQALLAAHAAIEEVGGLVVGARHEADVLPVGPINEVWMIPETAVLPASAPPPTGRLRAA